MKGSFLEVLATQITGCNGDRIGDILANDTETEQGPSCRGAGECQQGEDCGAGGREPNTANGCACERINLVEVLGKNKRSVA